MFKTKAIPMLGLGTYRLNGSKCTEIIEEAFQMGYRHFDTAFVYENHADIGKALQNLNRKEIFLTTKILLEQIDFSAIEPSIESLCMKALEELKTDYIDLLLIHAPDHTKPMKEVWEAMAKQENIRSIGVSNFTKRHLKETMSPLISCACNQVEFHPFLFQNELLQDCKQLGIPIVAYRPFGKGELLQNPVIVQIANENGKQPSQIILSWLFSKGIAAIAKASSLQHLQENLDSFFTLSAEDTKKLDDLNQNRRFCMEDFQEFSYK